MKQLISKLMMVLIGLLSVVSANAADYTLKEGLNVLTSYTAANCTFVATKTGRVVIEAQEVYGVTCKDNTYQFKFTPGANYSYVCEVTDVTKGDVVSIKSGWVQNSGSKIYITSLGEGETIPVTLVSSTPANNGNFSWNTSGRISMSFNKAVRFSKIQLITSTIHTIYEVTNILLDNNNLTLDVSDIVMKALEDGTMAPGSRFAIQVIGLRDRDDETCVYQGPNGAMLQMVFIAPQPRYGFVDATIGTEHLSYTTANQYRMKSYYDPSNDADGILEVEFENDVKSLENVILSMGNIDLISAGKYHRSNLKYSIDGKKVIIDLRGELRSLHALFPNIVESTEDGATELLEFNTDHLTISMNNVVDVNGNPFYSSLPGAIGSFSFTMGYEEIADNLVVDGENVADGDAVKAGQEISLWVNEPVTFDAINVAYYVPVAASQSEVMDSDSDLGYEIKNITLNDYTVTPSSDGGIIITFTLPEMPGGVEGQPVVVSFVNVKSSNGIPHEMIVKFVLGATTDDPGDNPGGGDDPDPLPEPGKYKIHTYTANDGGIFTGLSENGEWAVIRLGSQDAGGDAIPELYEVATEKRAPIIINNQAFDIHAVSNDGNIVVGSYDGQPASYNRATAKLTKYPQRKHWLYGTLTSITPDGKYAVGNYNCYTASDFYDPEVPSDFYFAPLYVNVETGDTLALTGMPKYNQAHGNENATVLRSISPDGRYALGAMDWFYMQPASGCCFVYDLKEQTYKMIGFTEGATPRQNWTPDIPGLHHIENAMFSPDGKLIAGDAYMAKLRDDNSGFYSEYVIPYVINMENGETTYYDDAESTNMTVGGIDNEGTILGNPESGGPLRNFRVFYKQKFWIPFSDICKQRFGFNFSDKTGYEYIGTALGITGDGKRLVAFSDPTGESYVMDLGEAIETSCSAVDMFANYTTNPQNGAVFSKLEAIEINFGRSVQVVGKGSTHVHLYKADGTLVRNALSTSDGLKLKTDSRTTVVATFRPTELEEGVQYYVTIDAGAVSVPNEKSVMNHEFRINFGGRHEGPVNLVRATPSDGASLRQLDAEASYINMQFDCPIKETEKCSAYLVRTEDNSRVAQLVVAVGNTAATNKQIMLIPASTTYLYNNVDYKVVLAAGSLSDLSGSESSLNEEITVNYKGTYVREVTNEAVMFSDNFSNPNASLNNWLMYEGDKNTPSENMQALGFDNENTPWNFSTKDTEESSDYFATSHSMYVPAGKSDDWMMTPQLSIPECGENDHVVLEFDAQSYINGKTDKLKIYVYENSKVLSNPLNNVIADIKANAELLDEVTLTPGLTQEKTAYEWKHFQYDLTPWSGKDIYVAFVNQNENQSAVFVDNVIIQREILYTIGFNNVDRVVKQDEIAISGKFKVELKSFSRGDVTLTLKDSEANVVSTYTHTFGFTLPGAAKEFDFAFDKPLPLVVGKENPYTIDIVLGDRNDTFKGSIIDLAFEPIKRVVLEEMTGYTCQFCPQGIIAIEECKRTYGDRFIPVSIHSYTGDRWGDGLFNSYSNFLGLYGAPTARINRTEGIFLPMFSTTEEIYYDYPSENLWYNIVAQELSQPAVCDLTVAANYDQQTKYINVQTNVSYALDADNQQVSLFVVVLESGLARYQQNALYQNTWKGLGEWANGGIYASAQPNFVHDDVVRATIGQTLSGTIGLFPSDYVAGEVHTATVSTAVPQTILNRENVDVVAMLIDTQTGLVINSAKAKVLPYGINGIESVTGTSVNSSVMYNLAGQRITAPAAKGIVISNGKKIVR